MTVIINNEPAPVAQATSIPTRKVGAGALAGALSVILVWVANRVLPPEAQIPAEIASSFTTLLTFFVSYIVSEP